MMKFLRDISPANLANRIADGLLAYVSTHSNI